MTRAGARQVDVVVVGAGFAGLRSLHTLRAQGRSVAVLEAGSQLSEPRVILLGVAVGLLSSVIPYSLELIALRRIAARVFSILMSLEPAAAALAGMILLAEFLSPVQWLAMACVVIASVGATRTGGTPAEPMTG